MDDERRLDLDQEKGRRNGLINQRDVKDKDAWQPTTADQEGLLERLLLVLTKSEKKELARQMIEAEDWKDGAAMLQQPHAPATNEDRLNFDQSAEQSPLIRSRPRQQAGGVHDIGPTHLPEQRFRSREGVSQKGNGDTLRSRAPRKIEPIMIMEPIIGTGNQGAKRTSMLYGPPLPVYQTDWKADMAERR